MKFTWKNNTELGFRNASIKNWYHQKRLSLQDDPQVVEYFCFVCCEDNFSGTNRYEIPNTIS